MNPKDVARVFALFSPVAVVRSPYSELQAVADEYERWLRLQQLVEQVFADPQRSSDRALTRKAYAIGQQAEAKLKELRNALSRQPSRNRDELARKARIVRFDASSWLDEANDSLFISLCDDALALAGLTAIAEPYPIPGETLRRLEELDFDAPPVPWEDDENKPVGES